MKNRGYSCNEEINRELEECRSRLEAEEEKWRDEIARIAPETREAGSGSAGLESEGFARAGRAGKALRSATAALENERMGRES